MSADFSAGGAHRLDQVQHREQRVAVFLDLGALVPVLCVFHRQRVQVKLGLHLRQLGGGGILQRDPDKTVRARDVFTDLFDRNVAQLVAVLVGHTVDQHGASFEGMDVAAFWHAAQPF